MTRKKTNRWGVEHTAQPFCLCGWRGKKLVDTHGTKVGKLARAELMKHRERCPQGFEYRTWPSGK